MALVGFFDILGSKAAISSGRFSDLTTLDFAGPASLAAMLFPAIRVSIFSDFVIVSAEAGNYPDFLKAVSLMYGQWWADFILVRGGIAEGEIRWVDHEPIDAEFRLCRNLSCSRVYGDGLVLAYEAEQRSGPGAIPYLTEIAADLLSEVEENSVLQGVTPMFCWASEKRAELMLKYASLNSDHEAQQGNGRRHALATKSYWEQVVEKRKFLPNEFDIMPMA